MANRFFEENVMREDVMAAGDAPQLSSSLQVTQSVLSVMGNDTEEVSDDGCSSTYDEVSSEASSDQPLSLCPSAVRERFPYPPPHVTIEHISYKPVLPLKKSSNTRVNYIRTTCRSPSGPNIRDIKYSSTKKPRPIRLQRSRSNSCVNCGPTLRLEAISKLLSCMVCKVVPVTSSTVHCCANGHQACGHCFSIGYRTCMECKKPLTGRNEVVEKVLQRLRQVCPGLFPHEGLVPLNSELKLKLVEAEKTNNAKKLNKFKLLQHFTHRPLDCPHLSCRRVIAANGFIAHFQFEHSSVPVFEMSPNCAHQFALSHRCFENRKPRAIAIIEVNLAIDKCGAVPKISNLTDPEKKATFLMRRDAVVCVLLGATVQVRNSVFLLAWCACLHEEETPLTYCIRATSTRGSKTSYNGPTSSLHNCQDPTSILKKAQCLVLSSAVFGQDKDFSHCKKSIFDLQFNLK